MNRYTILSQVIDTRGVHRQAYVHLWFIEAPDYFSALHHVTSDALEGFTAFLIASWDGWIDSPMEEGAILVHRNIRVVPGGPL